jgi:hypothetical protein
MKIIAIGHQKLVGKNTFATFCANILRDRSRGSNIQVVNMANGLKDACHMLYSGLGLEGWQYYEQHPDKKDIELVCGKTPRRIWLDIGAILNVYDSHIFIRQAVECYKCDYLFIPDLRRRAEIEYLADRAGVTSVKINRGTPQRYGDIDDELLAHNFDAVIENDGSLNDLHKKAETFVMETLLGRSAFPVVELR